MKNNDMPIPFKVVLIGESGVGKTSIITRYTTDSFSSVMLATTGASFASRTIEVDNQKIKFEIWDTAGQEQYRSIAQIFYKNTSGCILVYDISKRETYDEIKDYWIKEIKENAPDDLIIALAGNKSDMYEEETVTEEEAKEFARENGIIFKLTSAKQSTGIEELFNIVARKYLDPNYVDNSNLSRSEEEKMRKKERVDRLRNKSIYTSYSKLEKKDNQKKNGCCS